MPTLQPYPFEKPITPEAPPPPVAPPAGAGVPELLRALLDAIKRLPGETREDTYLYDERGITAANPTLDIDVEERLGRAAVAGFVIADSATIKMDINNKGLIITVFTSESFVFRSTDPFTVRRLRITSTSTVAAVRVFLV